MPKNDIAQFGSQILNAGMGGVFGVIGNRISAQQTKEMADYNHMLNEMSAEAADKRTRALYEDYMSPSAMLEQYRQANLSPSLMFGGGGVGGASMPNGAQGEGASGLAPRVFSPLEAAQTALTVAQTEKVKAETKTENETREPTIQNLQADLEKKITETNLIGLKQVYQEYENSVIMLELQYSASTTDERIQQFFKQGELLVAQVKSAKAKGKVDEATVDDCINLVKQQALNYAADTMLKNSQVRLNDTQRTSLIKQLEIASQELDLNREKLEAQIQQWGKENGLKKEEIDTMFTGIVVNGVAQGMGNVLQVIKFAKSFKGSK